MHNDRAAAILEDVGKLGRATPTTLVLALRHAVEVHRAPNRQVRQGGTLLGRAVGSSDALLHNSPLKVRLGVAAKSKL